MPKSEYKCSLFRITHTLEEDGPHPTIPYDYYEDTFVITILIRAQGSCYIEGNNFPLTDGDIVVMSPDDIHSFQFAQSGYHERVSIYLSSAVLTEFSEHQLTLINLFRKSASNTKYIYSVKEYDNSVFAPIVRHLCDMISKKNVAMQNAQIHLALLQLLFLLYDVKSSDTATNNSYTQNSVIGELCSYIKSNLKSNLSYQELQNRFFVSRYQLTKQFQYHTGMTLTEYIINKRLMHVISLVRNGEGIEQAVYDSGFNTYSHFYKEFVKHFHVSPKEYFKLHQ